MIDIGDNVKFYNNEDGTVRQEPENKYLIYPLEGKDGLEEIMKEQKIANDFPIECKTKEEEKLKKLLGYDNDYILNLILTWASPLPSFAAAIIVSYPSTFLYV